MSFFAELRRRNVIRVAGLYVVSAWLLVQIASTLLPAFEVPGWVLRAIIIVLALGFLPALVFSWVFELTPEGLKRESEIDRAHSIVDHTARKLDVAVILLLLAVGAMVWFRPQTLPERGAEPLSTPGAVALAPGEQRAAVDATTAAPAAGVVEPEPVANPKSIAVLPFADFSPGGNQSWFADGLAEEILNALARTPDLAVAARTSSFRYKGSTLAIPQIAKELGVAHVLEGSVRSSESRIRVTAQLIRAVDGFHVWSQNYDRATADMIEIQEDLARQIATAMQTSMDPEALADMARVGTRSVEAYQAYLHGVATAGTLEQSDYGPAYELFEQARQLDPSFAAAHARAALFWLEQLDATATRNRVTNLPAAEMREKFNQRIELAIQHASAEVDRKFYQALQATRELRMRDALALLQEVWRERPGDPDVTAPLVDLTMQASEFELLAKTLDDIWPQAQQRLGLADQHVNYAHRLADKRKAAEQALILLQRWPDQHTILYQVHRALLWDKRVEEAAAVLQRWEALGGRDGVWNAIPLARQACAEGRRADVEGLLTRVPPDDLAQRWHLLHLLGNEAEAEELLRGLERAGNTFALANFMTYPDFDPRPFPSLMAVLEREKVQRPPPVPLPFACPPAESTP